MKLTNLQELAKELKTHHPVIGVVAKEAYDRKSGLDVVLKGRENLSIKRFSGESASVEAILGDLEAPSFLADEIIVVVDRADKLKSAVTDRVRKYCEHPAKDNTLILVFESLASNTKLFKALAANGVMLQMPTLKPWEREEQMARDLVARAKREGKALSVDAAKQVFERTSGDALAAASELEKLVCYVGDRKSIQNEDIAAICGSGNTDSAFALGEAILGRRPGTAITLARAALKRGDAYIALLSMLRRQVQNGYTVCSILSSGGSANDVTKVFGYLRGRTLDKQCQMAQGFGLDRFRRALVLVSDAEFEARNSVAEPAVLAERLLIKMTQ